jgi:hypothetical protein
MDNKLQQFIEQAENLRGQNADTPEFNAWFDNVMRYLKKKYGSSSDEARTFNRIHFYNAQMVILGGEYQNDREFRNGLQQAILTLKNYQDDNDDETKVIKNNAFNKLFISHAKEDEAIVGEVINLLEAMGLTPSQIFCSSIEGYGVPLGKNFLDTLKTEISNNVLVLFILTNNFYESPFCLCEMGAFWVLANEQIPIVVPPFSFDDIEGVLPKNTQGLPINDKLKLNSLREKIIETFKLPQQTMSIWERKRDQIIDIINGIISETSKQEHEKDIPKSLLLERIKKFEEEIKNIKEKEIEKLVFRDGAYFDNDGDGPFCPSCYQIEGKKSRITIISNDLKFTGVHKCTVCGKTTTYIEK